MASSKQLMGMIRSHAAGDESMFLSIVEHIALDAERAGRGRMAGEIRTLVGNLRSEAASRRPATRPTPIASPRGELAGLVRATYPETRISDLVLSDSAESRIRGIVREHGAIEALAERGLEPRRKLLLSGPPGTGKTMTAAALAGELKLPLFTVMLDGVITKYMGETAAKLRMVFDAASSTRGVYFFDEVDALATSRSSDNDIGEARRVLNSLLQFLEEDESSSVLIAATNYPALLDDAIFRRFDAAFAYDLPDPAQIGRVIVARIGDFGLGDVDWRRVGDAGTGLSQADIVAAARDAARTAVLDHEGVIDTELLLQAIVDRREIHPK
ncbi:AAA family ATPase [Sphingomonas sp. NFX23]|uniref:AAA family ATPase n=1 Tax=Sphingomonas sp. NFX23 TaxID=2819532 RepID=UPI003CE7BD44